MLSEDDIWKLWSRSSAHLPRFTRLVEAETAEPLVKALNRLQTVIFQNVACDRESEAQIRAICDAALAAYRKEH